MLCCCGRQLFRAAGGLRKQILFIEELRRFIAEDSHLSVGLVCGMKELKKSEYAVLHKEEIQELLDAGKTSVTVSRKSGEKNFRVFVGGGRANAMQIPANRKF